MSRLQAIATLRQVTSVPAAYSVKQSDGIAWIMQTLQRSKQDVSKALNLYERLLPNDNIESRSTVLADYTHQDWDAMQLYRPSARDDGSATEWWAPPLQDRMKIYVEAAKEMAYRAYSSEEKAPDYIIDISCTGYRAPYPLQELVLKYSWENSAKLLKIGHMGCYASVPSLHMGAQLVRNLEADQTVSLLSTELCSLHLDPLAKDADQIVSNILFADGCARMDLAPARTCEGLDFYAHYEALVPDSSQYMSWDLHDGRFHMTLSRKVVAQLSRVIGSHLGRFLDAQGLSPRQITRFAIHPGGPRIVESLQEELGLGDEAVKHSRAVLRDHGNMSSATLPHVWRLLMRDDEVKSGEWIVSMAFGPGLTLTMNLMRKT